MEYIKKFLASIKYYLYYAAFIVVSLIVAYQKGRKKGSNEVKSEIQEKTIDKLKTSMEKVKNVQNEVNSASDDDTINRLRNKWMRKGTSSKDRK